MQLAAEPSCLVHYCPSCCPHPALAQTMCITGGDTTAVSLYITCIFLAAKARAPATAMLVGSGLPHYQLTFIMKGWRVLRPAYMLHLASSSAWV